MKSYFQHWRVLCFVLTKVLPVIDVEIVVVVVTIELVVGDIPIYAYNVYT